jgi:hypothetical protein
VEVGVDTTAPAPWVAPGCSAVAAYGRCGPMGTLSGPGHGHPIPGGLMADAW